MKRLVIIGNGFDIVHGLPTRYSDFKKYLTRNKYHEFCAALEKYIPPEELWANFEEALGTLDDELLQDDNWGYLLGYGDENWRDSAHHDFQYMIEQELSFSQQISSYMREWINSVNINAPPKLSSRIINNDCYFLSFNYTSTLETVYHIFPNNILYIHGNASRDQDEDIVVGHQKPTTFEETMPTFRSKEEWETYCAGLDDIRIKEARDIIKLYFKNTYKDTDAVIQKNKTFFNGLSDISEVYVLGHSLSMIDFDYFDEIKRKVLPQCHWYISCYQKEDYDNLRLLEQRLNLHNYSIISLLDI